MMIDLKLCNKVLSIFAHLDDETLAAGGTISKLSALGADVRVLIPATGVNARSNKLDDDQISSDLITLRSDCTNALSNIGVDPDNINFGEFPDNEMDTVSLLNVIQWMEKEVEDFSPDLIITHHKECTNIDHQICHEAVVVLSRPDLGCNILLYFAVKFQALRGIVGQQHSNLIFMLNLVIPKWKQKFHQ